jgi:hypothetical protein
MCGTCVQHPCPFKINNMVINQEFETHLNQIQQGALKGFIKHGHVKAHIWRHMELSIACRSSSSIDVSIPFLAFPPPPKTYCLH